MLFVFKNTAPIAIQKKKKIGFISWPLTMANVRFLYPFPCRYNLMAVEKPSIRDTLIGTEYCVLEKS